MSEPLILLDEARAQRDLKRDAEAAAAAEAANPHIQGPAVCLACKHEWRSVSPVGVSKLECPACGTERGVYATPIEQEGSHWTCKCGNHYFAISRGGIYCPCCGAEQVFSIKGEG